MYSLISKILRSAAPLLSAFSLIFVLLPTSVAAKDLISARSYWEDAQGQSTFDDAQAQPYTTYEGILAKGYSDSTFWFRLRIDPAPSAILNRNQKVESLYPFARTPSYVVYGCACACLLYTSDAADD